MANSRSQIIATIGPASRNRETIQQMIKAGMDVARLNFSWGTYEEHGEYIRNIREISKSLSKKVPIIQDLSGPRTQGEGEHHFDENKSALTDKDLKDLTFGLEQQVDYVALSYVGTAGDVLKLKDEMQKLGKGAPVIAKIERLEALTNFEQILEVSDAVMIARGDLGREVPVEEIPWYEKELIEKCREAGKPVIVATDMLASMVENEAPARAEVTDVFFAVMNGADAVMLSNETAQGEYPVESVSAMEKIASETEKHYAWEINPL